MAMDLKRFLLLLAPSVAVLLPSAAFASSLSVTNPDFATPAIACSALGYAYQGSAGCNNTVAGSGLPFPHQDFNGAAGFGWTLGPNAGDGLTGSNNPNGNFQTPSFSGLPFTQAVFLQNAGSTISQVVPGFSAATNYVLSFYLGSRFANGNDGNQTVEALLNGNVIGTWALTSFTPFTLESVALPGGASGSETLEFEGLAQGDHTAFLSDVSISSVPEPSSLGLAISGLALLAGFLRRARTSSRT